MGEITSIKISGLKELERLLKRLPRRIAGKVVDNALRAGGQVIARDARARVPVLSGDLKKSITVRKAPRRQRRFKGQVVVGFKSPTSRRAHLTEFGTRRARAQPFMRPALAAKGAEAIVKIGQALGKQIERAAAKLAGSFAKSGLAGRR